MKAVAFFDKRINSNIEGVINFQQMSLQSPLFMDIQLSGFKPNSIHAIHVHEFGNLTEGCKTLGPHFNPTKKKHGHSEQGHAGDLFNNFMTDKSGKINLQFSTKKLSIFPHSKVSIIGRSVVIHQFPDDYGLKGRKISEEFVLYRNMNFQQLLGICNQLGYTNQLPKPISMKECIDKLETESEETGNASTRIACSIVGINS